MKFSILRFFTALLAGFLGCFPLLAWADEYKEVITADEIAKEKPTTLMALLKQKAGVGDSNGAITLRGIPKVVVYLDGVPLGTGVIALDGVRPEDAEKIEIYRGAASSRFGADALGGAIVITTKKGKKELHLDIIQGYNSINSRYTRVIGSGGFEDYDLRLSLEDNRTSKIYNIDKNNNPFPYLQPMEESYSTKREGELKAGHQWGGLDSGVRSLELGVGLSYAEESWHWGRPNYYRMDSAISPKFIMNAEADGYKLFSAIGYEKRDMEVIKDKGGTDAQGLQPYSRLISPFQALDVELHAVLKGGNLGAVYGLEETPYTQRDYFTNALISELKAKREKMAVSGAYSLPLWAEGSLEASGRYDRYRYFDISVSSASAGGSVAKEPVIKESFNPKLSLTWKREKGLVYRISAGTGFTPPSPSALYFEESLPTYHFLPNPDLKPERSFTFDAGVEGEFPYEVKGGVTIYYTVWTDKMEILTTPGAITTSQLQNIGESESGGAEMSLTRALGNGWSSSLSYTFTATKITKSADPAAPGKELPNSPQHRANLAIFYDGIEDFTVKANVRYESAQFTDSRNTVVDANGYQWRQDAYSVMDLSIVKKMKVGETPVDLILAIDNLFDHQYRKGFFQVDPGRVIRGEIAVRF